MSSFINFFKHFFFLESSAVIKKAKFSHVSESDMLPLPEKLDPRKITFPEDRLDWTNGRRLLFSIIAISKKELFPAYSWYFASSLFALSTPWLVNRFITMINAGVTDQNLYQALGTGALLGFCGMATGLCLQHYFYHALGAYQVVNSILNKKIFNHSLKLSLEARQKNQIGDVVNYMSTDSEAAADFTFVFGDLTSSIVMIVGIVIMLFSF